MPSTGDVTLDMKLPSLSIFAARVGLAEKKILQISRPAIPVQLCRHVVTASEPQWLDLGRRGEPSQASMCSKRLQSVLRCVAGLRLKRRLVDIETHASRSASADTHPGSSSRQSHRQFLRSIAMIHHYRGAPESAAASLPMLDAGSPTVGCGIGHTYRRGYLIGRLVS